VNKQLTEQDIRDAVNRALGRPVLGSIWQLLKGKRYVLEALENARAAGDGSGEIFEIDSLISEAQDWQSAFEESTESKNKSADSNQYEKALMQQNKVGALRQEVLSEIYAKMAAADEDVIAFREEVLGGKTMKWGEVEAWIEGQIQKEEPYKTGGSCLTLSYLIPGNKSVYHKAVRVGGVLDGLRGLSESLAKYYGWADAQATVFVLADVLPLVSLIRATYTAAPGARRINGRLCSQPGATRRITLEIDPTFTDKQVAKVYRQVRRNLLKTNGIGSAINRPLSEKHLELARFGIRQPEDRPAWKRLNLWNMACENRKGGEGGWQETYAGNLNRDCKAAVKRLLNPGSD